MQNQELQIDVEALFAKKNPKLARLMPAFVFNWIKKIIHQTDINRVLKETKDLKDGVFTKYILDHELQAKITTIGIENIPKSGGAILVSNHPLGGLDGMVLMMIAEEIRPDVRVIVNDLLAEIPNYGDIFIPVNKLGNKAKETLQKVEDGYKNGNLMLVFPAGLCSRKNNGIIRDTTWQKSFVSRAIKYQLPVIPIHFSGSNSKRFYNISKWRKFFGIKANIEMFFLVDELYLQKGQEFHIHIGPPISPNAFDKKHSQAEWAELVKNHVYCLQEKPDLIFSPE